MNSEKRSARMQQIEAVAYDMLAKHGYDGTSMLAVAKAAKASNETLYRWYGDKNGLFLNMVQSNAQLVRGALDASERAGATPLERLRTVAPVLLRMLLGNRAILLNRAAAADPSGTLGRAIAMAGREEIFPLLQNLMAEAIAQGELAPPDKGEIATLFMHLLVGDQQVRRAIGTLAEPSQETILRQAECAMAQFETLCDPRH